MNITSPYSTSPFYSATSALSANPAYGNIGYANRVSGVGDFWGDLGRTIGGIGAQLGLGTYVDTLIGTARRSILQSQGYEFLEAVQVGNRQGVKVKAPDGTFKVLFGDGSMVPFTSQVQTNTRTIDPQTGAVSGTAIGIAAVVGLGLLAYFVFSKRR